MAEEQKTVSIALIGLIGTALTVCSGFGSAAIGAAATIYEVNRSRQQVELAAPESGQRLNVNLEDIFTSEREARRLDRDVYLVDLEHGFALLKPLTGWSALEERTLGEVAAEAGARVLPTPPWSQQPVFRIRYGEPIEIEWDRTLHVNGQPAPEAVFASQEALYGPPPWTTNYYSQVTIYVFDKQAADQVGFHSLLDIVTFTMQFSSGHVNRLVAREGSNFIMAQTSTLYEGGRIEGASATFTLEDWILFAESEKAYYTFEIVFIPQSGHSVQVWEDLQTYMNSFRVIR